MGLFQLGNFTLHSGDWSDYKIECDFLDDEDWKTLASLIVNRVPLFSQVEGVPSGGLKLAEALQPYCCSTGGLLIVDDVLTTGASMEVQRAGRSAYGMVVFSREWYDRVPSWISALFYLSSEF